ncbi:MAG TPA: arginine deiminase family protein [Salinivirgaceae bacterium]|nr:arginine deiminase family protein [Salinivirgaceae bacterium]
MPSILKTHVTSEIGKLEGVILHFPGPEVENMTPQNAERALYSDILNLSVVQQEYANFKGAIEKHTKVYLVKDLLREVLVYQRAKDTLLDYIFINENPEIPKGFLLSLSDEELARQLIEGVILSADNLTKYLNKERYALRPLHNFFFTRDSAITIGDKVLIARMANHVRERESLIMKTIFDYHPLFRTTTINPFDISRNPNRITIEGGDILVAREDVLLVGLSSRTSSQGIDFILEQVESKEQIRHIIVQELPPAPESFIHLDMVFTFLDFDACMVFEPVILRPNRYQTIHISVDNGNIRFKNEENLLVALNKLGFDLKPIICGGSKDPWIQEREQWHSGANFFALAPGKVIGYGRNTYTIEEMNKHGFEVLPAADVANGTIDVSKYKKYVIALDGSELPRGGGGARCMTMPVARQTVQW